MPPSGPPKPPVPNASQRPSAAQRKQPIPAGATAAPPVYRPAPPPARPAPPPVYRPQAGVQRAIAIGRQHLPRTLDDTALQKDFNLLQIAKIKQDHALRDTVFLFVDKQHFVDYYQGKPAFPPMQEKIAPKDLDEGHKRVGSMRFGTIYQPAPNQFPQHAPGGHKIVEQELPPSGPGHHWALTKQGVEQQNTLWVNKLEPPKFPTELHTFGDKQNPSVVTSQGIHNMGMRIMPTTKNVTKLPRSKTKYGGLPSETGQVRGHPYALEQTQYSTKPGSSQTFDNTPILYTNESDGTKGGLSTFRYNKVEKPSIKEWQPFNQVNISSNPQKATTMKRPHVKEIHFSMRQKGGKYKKLKFDNTVDYRTQIGKGKIKGEGFHSRLEKHVTTSSFPYERVHKPGSDFEDSQRHSYKGYESPPPTPFLTHEMMDEEPNTVLKGVHHQNESVIHNGDLWFIVEAVYDAKNNVTTCKLEKAFTTSFKF